MSKTYESGWMPDDDQKQDSIKLVDLVFDANATNDDRKQAAETLVEILFPDVLNQSWWPIFQPKSDSARLIHNANVKCFRLRAMLLDEKMRVEKTADVVEWNALTHMSELSKELSDTLVEVANL